jgi:hypothetical protein
MNKFFFSFIAILVFHSPVFAQQTTPNPSPAGATPVADPSDPKTYLGNIQQYGVPTVEAVSALRIKATDLFEKGDCNAAVPALIAYRTSTNWIANLISAGLEPFYDASFEKRKQFRHVGDLVQFEEKSNFYKSERDRTGVLIAECYVKLNQIQEAAAMYLAVLNSINIDDWEWWSRARNGLYAILKLSN